jgi:hypothetical protein
MMVPDNKNRIRVWLINLFMHSFYHAKEQKQAYLFTTMMDILKKTTDN